MFYYMFVCFECLVGFLCGYGGVSILFARGPGGRGGGRRGCVERAWSSHGATHESRPLPYTWYHFVRHCKDRLGTPISTQTFLTFTDRVEVVLEFTRSSFFFGVNFVYKTDFFLFDERP